MARRKAPPHMPKKPAGPQEWPGVTLIGCSRAPCAQQAGRLVHHRFDAGAGAGPSSGSSYPRRQTSGGCPPSARQTVAVWSGWVGRRVGCRAAAPGGLLGCERTLRQRTKTAVAVAVCGELAAVHCVERFVMTSEAIGLVAQPVAEGVSAGHGAYVANLCIGCRGAIAAIRRSDAVNSDSAAITVCGLSRSLS